MKRNKVEEKITPQSDVELYNNVCSHIYKQITELNSNSPGETVLLDIQGYGTFALELELAKYVLELNHSIVSLLTRTDITKTVDPYSVMSSHKEVEVAKKIKRCDLK